MGTFVGESLPLTELRNPVLRRAYEYWCLRKGDRPLPSRKDISPEDMKTYLSNVMLIDVSYEPLDFVYRVFGSGIAQAHGKEYTGKSVRELEPPEFSNLVWHQYLEVVRERKPCLHGICFQAEGKYHKYHRLTSPLSSDGSTIDKLLAVSIEDGKFWATFSEASHHAERRGTLG
ncbi:MAG TPA: PAS domain-containing protein [Stellaceae bacterium]|nr:PAS domain-containing protein [Stellaceae bacterium]